MTGNTTIETETEFGTAPELTEEMVRAQLDLLVHDEAFRASKRSVAFLRYVVDRTLAGQADQIKERAVGIEVFGRDPAYDTNVDHIVRTAAAELRKRLATYYVDEKHRSELRMGFVPGSYVPRFTLPNALGRVAAEPNGEEIGVAGEPNGSAIAHPAIAAEPHSTQRRWVWAMALGVIGVIVAVGFHLFHRSPAQDLFWQPVIDTPGPVLLAVGDHPNGPPTMPETDPYGGPPTPVPSFDASQTVPFADTVTIARVFGALAAHNKTVLIRRGSASSFSDLREGAVVLIGAFNNEWSLRLTRELRYTLALDPDRHLIYIRDSRKPADRSWNWGTNQPREPLTGANSPRMEDYALISRIRDSETGHVVVVIGGLYTYGTQAAGEFLTNPEYMKALGPKAESARTLQIVLATTVTDGTPGPPRVVTVTSD
jgi:hypothetical protein